MDWACWCAGRGAGVRRRAQAWAQGRWAGVRGALGWRAWGARQGRAVGVARGRQGARAAGAQGGRCSGSRRAGARGMRGRGAAGRAELERHRRCARGHARPGRGLGAWAGLGQCTRCTRPIVDPF